MIQPHPSAQPGPTRIRVLSDALVDQIAAGEVVERPASVVKELVENSLDAGARSLQIDVRDGGAALIAVQDDGIGMTPEELPIALERHATSKLRTADDLSRITSFGFRGEALPAIASVSRFRIVSRARGAESGHEIRIDGGRLIHSRAAGGPEGTRIEVADLFASVPARRKFLKRPSTEWGHISDWLARLAMARPEIHLEIRRDERTATIWPACSDRRDRLALLLSDEDAAGLVAVEHATEAARVHGFVSTPEQSRATGQGLYLFVNGRPVRDRLLSHALCEPYRDLLPRGRFPLGVVFVDVAPETVDVNVHPAKWEVRFSDPQAVHRSIRHAVRESIASRRWLSIPLAAPGTAKAAAPHDDARTLPLQVQELAPRWGSSGQGPARGALDFAASPSTDWTLAARHPDRFDADLGSAIHPNGPVDAAQTIDHAAPPVTSFAALRLLGQLHASYLLAEGEQGLVVIDQHAAHERILYERMRKSWLEAGVARQGLLSPLVVKVSPAAVAAVEASAESIARLGFEIEPFADAALLVRAVPAELAGSDPEAIVRDLTAALVEHEPDPGADPSAVRWLPGLDRMFATLACHAARRFGDRLPEAEQRAILAGLDTIPWAPTCPHGRPVAILIGPADLEARFRRR